MNSKIRTALLLLLGILLAHCGATLYMPKPEDATANASFEELQNGRTLYARHCSSCHTLYAPGEFSDEQWRKVVPEMRHRAKLADPEWTLIEKYLITGSHLSRTQ